VKLFSFRFWLKTVTIFTIFLVVFVVYCNWRINSVADPYCYHDLSFNAKYKVGLLLGTSKFNSNGKPNLYFFNRIDAAVRLYNSGKIKFIIVSGDNRSVKYNEPMIMKRELVKRGIPAEVIFVDYAGFRTLDSVIRAKEIFGQNTFIIISQEFHTIRAVFIARRSGIEAFGYNAEDVRMYNGFFTRLREIFARVKVFLDIYVFHTHPKYLGVKVVIE
jgi:SanA protein